MLPTSRALLVTAALMTLGSPVAADPASDVIAIRAVLDAQVVAWNAGDLEGYMKGYWRSPELSFFGGGTRTRGFDETLARYRRKYKDAGHGMGALSFSDLAIDVLSADAAIARGGWHLVLHDGKKPEGLFTLVLRRKPDGWRIVHDHSSAD